VHVKERSTQRLLQLCSSVLSSPVHQHLVSKVAASCSEGRGQQGSKGGGGEGEGLQEEEVTLLEFRR